MKSYIIGLLGISVIFLISLTYKQQNVLVWHKFPIPKNMKSRTDADAPFYLFLFFSKHDCESCLVEVVQTLNTLPPQFYVAGVAPEEELKDEVSLRHASGAKFVLYSNQKFKNFLPARTPTLVGISPSGKTILIIPSVYGQTSCLETTLAAIYSKLFVAFEKEQLFEQNNEK